MAKNLPEEADPAMMIKETGTQTNVGTMAKIDATGIETTFDT